MRLRLVSVLALGLLVLGAFAGSSSSATPKPTIDPFLGTWKMTSGADAALVGWELHITASTAAGAKILVGPEWTNVTDTAYYDQYCGSQATVYGYVVLQYTWDPQGLMGGCISNKTGPHIVFAGSHKEAGSVRLLNPGQVNELTGVWDTIENSSIVHHHMEGARPSVSFTVGEQGHRALPQSTNGPKFLLTKLLGSGIVSLGDGETDFDGVYKAGISAAIGTIHFHKWRVFEHGVIDEDLLVLKVQTADGNFYRKRAETDAVRERLPRPDPADLGLPRHHRHPAKP